MLRTRKPKCGAFVKKQTISEMYGGIITKPHSPTQGKVGQKLSSDNLNMRHSL